MWIGVDVWVAVGIIYRVIVGRDSFQSGYDNWGAPIDSCTTVGVVCVCVCGGGGGSVGGNGEKTPPPLIEPHLIIPYDQVANAGFHTGFSAWEGKPFSHHPPLYETLLCIIPRNCHGLQLLNSASAKSFEATSAYQAVILQEYYRIAIQMSCLTADF